MGDVALRCANNDRCPQIENKSLRPGGILITGVRGITTCVSFYSARSIENFPGKYLGLPSQVAVRLAPNLLSVPVESRPSISPRKTHFQYVIA